MLIIKCKENIILKRGLKERKCFNKDFPGYNMTESVKYSMISNNKDRHVNHCDVTVIH